MTRVAVKYAPVVMDRAVEFTKKATNGKVQNIQDAVKYIGSSPNRLSVVAGAFARAGVAVDDIVPADLAGSNAQLAQIRSTLEATVGQMQNRYDSGADRTLGLGTDGDIIRKERVQAALRIYGSERTYFLCHPNGGIPREDFAWYTALFRR